MSQSKDIDRPRKKLEQITGRKDSVKKLEPFLMPDTPEEAQEMGNQIEKSDRLKKVFGTRPEGKDIKWEMGDMRESPNRFVALYPI